MADDSPDRKKTRSRRGATMVEFTLLGIPTIFLFTSILTCSIDMWQFFTLSYAVDQTARYAATHGAGCASSCTITRADVATYLEGQAIALSPSLTTMVLNDGSGAITCNPVTACPSGTSQFPSSGHNTAGTNTVTITVTYALTNPFAMFWPSAGSVRPGTFTVGGKSTQVVLF
jgi:Flp pilus assembly protein TadG